MTSPKFLRKTKAFIAKVSPKTWVIGGVLFAAILYGIVFFIPKSVLFSYAQTTCVGHFALAPSLQRFESDEFEGTLKGGVGHLFSTELCLTPKESPETGSRVAKLSPFGGFVAQKHFRVEVPKAPLAHTGDFIGKTISATQPLKIKLSEPDALHTYTLKIADKMTSCAQVSAELSCDMDPLDLNHGTEYTAELQRAYKEELETLVEGTFATLQPLLIEKASIKNKQTVYDMPTSLTFRFSQPVESSEVSFTKGKGDKAETIETQQKAEGSTLTISFGELARETDYVLELKQAVGTNGSSLAEPVTTKFKTSGGPKVTKVSIGSSGVSRSATIVVTFDQPIDKSVTVAKFARVEGATATVSRQSDKSIAFSLRGGDCKTFTLIVDKGIKSGSNNLTSKAAWRHTARTTCGYAWSIGSSVQGRSIVAYSFGSGSKTILMTGGIHGSEPSSVTTLQAFVGWLRANAYRIPSDKRIVVVPNTNPDGIAMGTRYNARNVNLGRNFPTKNWSASIDTASGRLPKGGGTSAGSEPEAKALIRLTRQLRPRLEVSYHAQGSLVGANKYGDSVRIGNIYAQTVGYGTMYYNAEDVMGYAMTGEYEDWMGEEMNIPAILIELPSHGGNYLTSQLPALLKLFKI